MPVIPIAEHLAANAVLYTWSGDAPFDVWLRGELVASQVSTTSLVVEYAGEAAEPWIEVLDANDVGPAASWQHSPRLRLQWRGQADAGLYYIERKNGSNWDAKAVVRETGRGYYPHVTLPEAHGATAQWRVRVEDDRGHEGAAVLEHTETVVCIPETPAVTGAYDEGTGDLTVSAVA